MKFSRMEHAMLDKNIETLNRNTIPDICRLTEQPVAINGLIHLAMTS